MKFLSFEDQSSHLQGPIYAEVEAFDQEQTDLIPHAMQRHTCYIAPPAMQSISNTVTARENYLINLQCVEVVEPIFMPQILLIYCRTSQ